jgi:anti-sigma-K factor RskA
MTMLNEDDIMLAGEYALGLLDPAAYALATARLATDGEFASEVEAWRTRLQPIAEGAPQAPPAHIWNAISAQLPPETTQDNSKNALRWWQGISVVSAGAAAVMAAMLFLQPAPVPAPAPTAPATPLIAALGSETGNAALTASYDANSGQMVVTPVSLATGKLYPELWIVPADGKARSLGIIAGDHATSMTVPAALRGYLGVGGTLAITPEPEGGAPGGKATGPIIASGKITAI